MDKAALVLSMVALVFYTAAWGLYIYRNLRHDTGHERIASRMLTVGFFAQTMSIAALILVTTGFLTASNVLLLVSWVLFFACFMFEVLTKKRDRSVFLLSVPLVLLVLSLVLR